jgi:hypothetical protein
VIKGQATPTLLDSYEDERIRFAHTLVATTDRLFVAAVSRGIFARFLRLWLLPKLLRPLLRLSRIRKWLFQRVSQIGVTYRGVPPNRGKAGSLEAGDQLPWVRGDGLENFLPLRALNWQVHLYDGPNPEIKSFCAERNIVLYARAWSRECHNAGLQKRALYLVRRAGTLRLCCASGIASTPIAERSIRLCRNAQPQALVITRYTPATGGR